MKNSASNGKAHRKIDGKQLAHSIGEAASAAADNVGKTAVSVAGKTKELASKSQEAVYGALDQNGDGEVNIEDVILMGLRVPGIRVNREQFLRKELQSKCTPEVIEKAVSSTPLRAGIPQELINEIADEVIQYERVCVSGISTALGMPGGVAMAATIPADIAQYYGYMLRATQKLMYLYGFPQIDVEENGQVFDSETMNLLILCMGVMYGVVGANNALKAVAKALGTGVEKQLLRRALTKGTIYPIVKSVSKWFGVRMTKQIFAGVFKKAIPVVGGVLGGGITYLSFKPCCDKLKASLQNTILSNPDYQNSETEDAILAEFPMRPPVGMKLSRERYGYGRNRRFVWIYSFFSIDSSALANASSCSFVRLAGPFGCLPARRSFLFSWRRANRLSMFWAVYSSPFWLSTLARRARHMVARP